MASKVKCLRGLAVVAGLAVLTPEAQAEVLFRGVFKITNVNAACTQGPNKGYLDNTQFHPRGLGNDNFTALTTISNFGGRSYKLEGADFGTSFTPVITQGLGWSAYTADKKASVLIDPVPIIGIATNFLTLTGKIKNIYGNSGQENCVADFRAVLYKITE